MNFVIGQKNKTGNNQKKTMGVCAHKYCSSYMFVDAMTPCLFQLCHTLARSPLQTPPTLKVMHGTCVIALFCVIGMVVASSQTPLTSRFNAVCLFGLFVLKLVWGRTNILIIKMQPKWLYLIKNPFVFIIFTLALLFVNAFACVCNMSMK